MFAKGLAKYIVFQKCCIGLHKAARQHIDMEFLAGSLIEMIDIRVRAFRRHNLVPDAVQSCCKHAGKREIRVAHRVRAAELSTGAVAAGCRYANKPVKICSNPGNIKGAIETTDKPLI